MMKRRPEKVTNRDDRNVKGMKKWWIPIAKYRNTYYDTQCSQLRNYDVPFSGHLALLSTNFNMDEAAARRLHECYVGTSREDERAHAVKWNAWRYRRRQERKTKEKRRTNIFPSRSVRHTLRAWKCWMKLYSYLLCLFAIPLTCMSRRKIEKEPTMWPCFFVASFLRWVWVARIARYFSLFFLSLYPILRKYDDNDSHTSTCWNFGRMAEFPVCL